MQDGGPSTHCEPPGGASKKEQEEERRRRRWWRANAGLSKWPPGEEESTKSREEEITQPLLFSHPLPWQVERLAYQKTLVNLYPAGANMPWKTCPPINNLDFSHMKREETSHSPAVLMKQSLSSLRRALQRWPGTERFVVCHWQMKCLFHIVSKNLWNAVVDKWFGDQIWREQCLRF